MEPLTTNSGSALKASFCWPTKSRCSCWSHWTTGRVTGSGCSSTSTDWPTRSGLTGSSTTASAQTLAKVFRLEEQSLARSIETMTLGATTARSGFPGLGGIPLVTTPTWMAFTFAVNTKASVTVWIGTTGRAITTRWRIPSWRFDLSEWPQRLRLHRRQRLRPHLHQLKDFRLMLNFFWILNVFKNYESAGRI